VPDDKVADWSHGWDFCHFLIELIAIIQKENAPYGILESFLLEHLSPMTIFSGIIIAEMLDDEYVLKGS
jgi:hypothetical protein